MKKIIRTLVAASVLICGMVFTGCDFIMQQKLKNTEGRWYKYEGDIHTFPVGASEDSEEGTPLQDAEMFLYFNRDAGLTVALQADKNKNVELYPGISTNMKLIVGNVNTYGDFSTTKWITLTEVAPIVACEAPKVYTNPDECILIGGDEANTINIQWKKVLANIILNKLLGE